MSIRAKIINESLKRYHQGDIVRHFKYETLSDEDKANKKYLYEIIGYGKHAETCEELVIYKALYLTTDTEAKFWVRSIDMFMDKVDTFKYPDIKQPYRFMLCDKNGELL